MSRIEELRQDIEDKQTELDDYKHNFDPGNEEFVEMYDNMLNECSGIDRHIQIGYITLKIDIAELMQDQDPTAYRCGACDYLDSLEEEQLPGYKELQEELEELQNELDDLESEEEAA